MYDALLQQLAAAKADAVALKTQRDQLAEVVLEMQVSVCSCQGPCTLTLTVRSNLHGPSA